MINQKIKSTIIAVFITMIFAMPSFCGDVADNLRIPEAGNKQIITLDDGSSLVGRITDIRNGNITFVSNIGETVIAIDKIKSIEEVSDSSFREGKYWFPNPNRTRLYFGPTARMLKAGEGYISDTYIFFPGFGLGLTDNVTIGGGMSIFPGLNFGDQLFYLTPKIGLKATKSADLAVSALILRIPNYTKDSGFSGLEDNSYIIGVLNIVGTIGTADKSLTAGLGYGFADGELADRPAVILGGEYRFARRLSFVSENWILPGVDVPMVSYGVRFFSENLAADLALFNILDNDAVFPGIPYLDFVWNF